METKMPQTESIHNPVPGILIVDDSQSDLEFLARILRDRGFEPRPVASGTLALRAARADPPDLILLDIRMPGMDGFELCGYLKADEALKDIPIIFITALSSTEDKVKAFSLGAVDYVSKPFQAEEILSRVSTHLSIRNYQRTLSLQNANLERLVAERTDELEKAHSRSSAMDRRMLQQDKLASLGQLAAGVAHEINSPMGYIVSNLFVLDGYTDDLIQFFLRIQSIVSNTGTEEAKRAVADAAEKIEIAYMLDDIRKLITESIEGAERVKRIVLDLKDFSRSDESQWLETDLNQCVKSTVNVVRNEIKYIADLELHLGEIPMVVCNPQQINQVITNLLVNAAQAIDGHGRISVYTASEGNQVILTIVDTGRGIPVEIRNRIFDPFFTTKEVGKGTGLGLSISYDIVEKHGGEIGYESEPGSGTSFTVRLPVSGPGNAAS
jgi:two-component system, NtrC family, sensor kinase